MVKNNKLLKNKKKQEEDKEKEKAMWKPLVEPNQEFRDIKGFEKKKCNRQYLKRK